MEVFIMSNSISRRSFLASMGITVAGLAGASRIALAAKKKTNILIITLDDMHWDSLGVTGCPIPNISPNIDKLASEGLRFGHAHVNIAICQPCRSVLMTGRYPHYSGALGFDPINANVPTLGEQTRAAGYMNGILSKVGHIKPLDKFCWDTIVQQGQLGIGRDPKRYYEECMKFFNKAKAENKPFMLMANSDDPHRPFAGSAQEARAKKKRRRAYPGVRRTFKPDEVPVPGFLPGNIDKIKLELSEYFASVYRADETVGEILRALKQSGMEEDTLVVFFSDHGMPLPYAKTNAWENSTRTPLIVRWPGRIKPGQVDEKNMVSVVDIMPTLIEAADLDRVKGMNGRSFIPLLKGKEQKGRDYVFTFMNRTVRKTPFPMRCIRDREYSYIYNSWSNGELRFRNESQSGRTWTAMMQASPDDPAIKKRVDFYSYRVPEEFYCMAKDPCELENRIDDPKYKDIINKMRLRLLQEMTSTSDFLEADFSKMLAKQKK
jgi:N-sulfoglucosamine sulfohydrolase